jgi:hypothetical protein
MTNKCTSSAGRFDGHSGAPEGYRWHRPMRHVGSHWMLPSGDYSLRITPATPGQQQTKQQQKNVPKRLAISMAVAVRWYNTACIAR